MRKIQMDQWDCSHDKAPSESSILKESKALISFSNKLGTSLEPRRNYEASNRMACQKDFGILRRGVFGLYSCFCMNFKFQF